MILQEVYGIVQFAVNSWQSLVSVWPKTLCASGLMVPLLSPLSVWLLISYDDKGLGESYTGHFGFILHFLPGNRRTTAVLFPGSVA